MRKVEKRRQMEDAAAIENEEDSYGDHSKKNDAGSRDNDDEYEYDSDSNNNYNDNLSRVNQIGRAHV